jgi:hypothetical protein
LTQKVLLHEHHLLHYIGGIVLALEAFCATSSLSYAVLLCRRTTSRKSPGLEPAPRNKFGLVEPPDERKLKCALVT